MVTKQPPPDAHWRDSARSPQLWLIDASAVFPLFLFLMHMRMWTFIITMIAVIFLSILNRYGFTVPVFLRWLRTSLAGKRKLANPWWY